MLEPTSRTLLLSALAGVVLAVAGNASGFTAELPADLQNSATLSKAAGLHGEPVLWAVPERVEVPVNAVILADGTPRYTIDVKIGRATVTAGLDTGSVGLRLLPGKVHRGDATATGTTDSHSFNSGLLLTGRVGNATVSLGGLSRPTHLQLVDMIGCTSQKPDCPASTLPRDQFGIMGDGIPGQGFPAIIGISMASAEIPNPLLGLGVRHWIVELPVPNSKRPGRLILNPTAAEMSGFALFSLDPDYSASHAGALHDSVPGCLVDSATEAKTCGALISETGAPGIDVQNGGLGATPWATGTPTHLTFDGPKGNPVLGEAFTIDDTSKVASLHFSTVSTPPGTVILSGLLAYFAFDVLYSPDASQKGFALRVVNAKGFRGVRF